MDENEDLNGKLPEEVVREATSMGWVPQDKFKGNIDKWIPADEFVEFGSKALPILQHNNKRLQKELLTRDQKLGTLETQLAETRQQMQALEKHYTEANKRAVQQARTNLLTELKTAREDDDLEAEQRILGQLDEVRQTLKDADENDKKKEKDKNDPPAKAYTEDLAEDTRAFMADNPWFDQDKKRTKAFMRMAEDMRDEGNITVGRAFMDEVLERLDADENEQRDEPQHRATKVEPTNNRSASRGTTGSFASLPAEAKKACHDDIDILVGPTKRFKNLKEWETEYAKLYYSN